MSSAWSLTAGLTLALAGSVVLAAPLIGALNALWLFGWLMMSAGLFELAYAWCTRNDAGAVWRFLIAALYPSFGAFLLFHPIDEIAPFALAGGALFLSRSAFLLLLAHDVKDSPAWGWLLLDATVGAVLGFLVLAGWPKDSLRFLALYTGVGMIIAGVLRARPESLQMGRQHSSLGA